MGISFIFLFFYFCLVVVGGNRKVCKCYSILVGKCSGNIGRVHNYSGLEDREKRWEKKTIECAAKYFGFIECSKRKIER